MGKEQDKSPHSEGNIRTGWCGVRRLVAAFGAGDLSPEAGCPPHEPLERSRLLTPALSSFEEERETDKCVVVQGFNARRISSGNSHPDPLPSEGPGDMAFHLSHPMGEGQGERVFWFGGAYLAVS